MKNEKGILDERTIKIRQNAFRIATAALAATSVANSGGMNVLAAEIIPTETKDVQIVSEEVSVTQETNSSEASTEERKETEVAEEVTKEESDIIQKTLDNLNVILPKVEEKSEEVDEITTTEEETVITTESTEEVSTESQEVTTAVTDEKTEETVIKVEVDKPETIVAQAQLTLENAGVTVKVVDDNTEKKVEVKEKLSVGTKKNSELRDAVENYADIISKYSKEYGVEAELVKAIIQQESSVNPNCSGYAYGLMQWEIGQDGYQGITLVNKSGQKKHVSDVMAYIKDDPDAQIEVGCAEFAKKQKVFKGNAIMTLKSYNIGEAGMKRFIGYYLSGGKNIDKQNCGISIEEIQEYAASGDTGWLESDAEKWYYEEGCTFFGKKSKYQGDLNYLSNVLRYYNTSKGDLFKTSNSTKKTENKKTENTKSKLENEEKEAHKEEIKTDKVESETSKKEAKETANEDTKENIVDTIFNSLVVDFKITPRQTLRGNIFYDNKVAQKKNFTPGAKKKSGDGYNQIYTSASGKTYLEYKQDSGGNGSYINDGWGQDHDQTIKWNGCGPTAVAIAMSGFGKECNPGDVAAKMGGAGTVTDKNKLKAIIKSYGFKASIVEKATKQELMAALETGNPVIVSVDGSIGNFTGEYHIMTLLDINSKGQVYVSNPNSKRNSGWIDLNTIWRAQCSRYMITLTK